MKILIVDDEMAALSKMKVLLAPYGDCTLSTNNHQALQLCAKAIQSGFPFDLITIDIRLGNASGHTLLEKIMEMESTAKVPSAKKIMITASGTRDNLVKARAKGCDDFLVKPVRRDALEQKLLAMGYARKNSSASSSN